jgi:quercetin dioxygenase-like cupin family protein
MRFVIAALALLTPLLAISMSGIVAAQTGPTVPFQGTYPITVTAGDYDLVYLVLDFAPGAAIPLHYHGGPATVVGMEGELTLRPHDAPEKKLGPGAVVTEMQGAHHVMINTSTANARILAVVLLPKGGELTTVVDTSANPPPGPTVPFQGAYPVTVAAGEYELVNLVLDFAPGAEIPLHFHGGPAVVVGMEGELTLRPQGSPERKLGPGAVVNEKMGAIHVMTNTSSANARILAGVLLPKGAELTTLVSQAPTGMPSTGAGDLGEMLLPLLLVGLLWIAIGTSVYIPRLKKR